MRGIVTVILTAPVYCDDEFARFDAIAFPAGGGLVSCDDDRFEAPWYGGDKRLEQMIYLGAFETDDAPAFVDGLAACLRRVGWSDPESVQLFIAQGVDSRFTEMEWR